MQVSLLWTVILYIVAMLTSEDRKAINSMQEPWHAPIAIRAIVVPIAPSIVITCVILACMVHITGLLSGAEAHAAMSNFVVLRQNRSLAEGDTADSAGCPQAQVAFCCGGYIL